MLALVVANVIVLRTSELWMRLRRDGMLLPSTNAIKLKVLSVRKARTAPERFEDKEEEDDDDDDDEYDDDDHDYDDDDDDDNDNDDNDDETDDVDDDEVREW